MRLENERESENVEDRRAAGYSGGIRPMHVGIGTIVVALAASYFFGIDPGTVVSVLGGAGGGQQAQQPAPTSAPAANDPAAMFVAKVLAETEDTWRDVFQRAGKQYQDPKLVLFSGATPTACGTGQTAMGPFYCPNDQKVYIDLAFYNDLRERFHAGGEFAEAYVIAHEVGHHVQNLLGVMQKVQAAQQRSGDQTQANALSVRLELQADCFAGAWAKRTDSMKQILEPGEVEQALRAASAIGDDRLQKQAQGYAVPETFTHGSSEQRVRWFTRGMQSGDINQCDTFSSREL